MAMTRIDVAIGWCVLVIATVLVVDARARPRVIYYKIVTGPRLSGRRSSTRWNRRATVI
jgi:hypothetical protein